MLGFTFLLVRVNVGLECEHSESIYAFDLDDKPLTLCWTCFYSLDSAAQRNLDKKEDIEGDPIKLINPHFKALQQRVVYYTLLEKLSEINEDVNPFCEEDQKRIRD